MPAPLRQPPLSDSAIQRLFDTCRSCLTHLPADVSREGHIQPIIEALERVTAADVGLTDPCAVAPPRPSGAAPRGIPPTAARASTPWHWLEAAQSRVLGGGAPLLPGKGVGPRPITYLHIYEDATFSMGIFLLPAHSCIPLHDHPGMSVLSKILYGSLHVRALDWTGAPTLSSPTGPPPQRGSKRLAQLVADLVMPPQLPSPSTPKTQNSSITASSLSSSTCEGESAELALPPSPSLRVLHPSSGGNIHEFRALSDTAILDVLSPPYNLGPFPEYPGAARDCTYYSASPVPAGDYPLLKQESEGGVSQRPLPGAQGDRNDLWWLQPCAAPKSLCIQQGKYRGPQVRVSAHSFRGSGRGAASSGGDCSGPHKGRLFSSLSLRAFAPRASVGFRGLPFGRFFVH